MKASLVANDYGINYVWPSHHFLCLDFREKIGFKMCNCSIKFWTFWNYTIFHRQSLEVSRKFVSNNGYTESNISPFIVLGTHARINCWFAIFRSKLWLRLCKYMLNYFEENWFLHEFHLLKNVGSYMNFIFLKIYSVHYFRIKY